MSYRNLRAMRPEAALENYGPRFGEYPVSLQTRRTWSLQADDVLNRRETSPNNIWVDARSKPYETWEWGEERGERLES